MGHPVRSASNELGEGVTQFGPWIPQFVEAPCSQEDSQ